MKAPDGSGWWEFRRVWRLHSKGRVFAITGEAYFPSIDRLDEKARGYAGCLTSVIIYDSDGDGKFDKPLQSGLEIRIPEWAK